MSNHQKLRAVEEKEKDAKMKLWKQMTNEIHIIKLVT